MWLYYRDVTLYGLAGCFLPAVGSFGLYKSQKDWLLQCVIFFGLFGTALGVLGFWYFQKRQYYMYYNLGYTKKKLWLTVFRANLFVAFCLFILMYLLM